MSRTARLVKEAYDSHFDHLKEIEDELIVLQKLIDSTSDEKAKAQITILSYQIKALAMDFTSRGINIIERLT